ncbi:putative DDE superfamily endonuclease [Monocercomonoides exilis]|uniref:putative DDE superfamily endonuclease n=1 Tax=Monocercomonoides exilis TaxID=2049356 RepID=UPI003559FE5B|nr:putative DDE superfamily endonuclease [Monocercomonoides exilis]|eukprot:MONOS_14003.1-p1 / transcript=MONOS_14003.1 / gene=MONOS_14003 / organism=Monocercomonoides_exilis_PA203 / gene_product=unspecified product / transcript_product=unspecified product / location=Mono_scaffold00919:16966-17628(-) / protein_length=220 / sequence_SO=supercontig / SO=protein_coding / is_pseudo=false
MKDVGVVVDCTVIHINLPAGRLEFGEKYFSGKHHIYCVKIEVGVNPRIGTACTLSSVNTGSTHDFNIFKDLYPQFQALLGGSKVLADSAFIGARAEIDAIISKPVGTPHLASRHVIVKRFFGRLKTLFAVFLRPRPFEVFRVGSYFSVACCLVNFHILHNPLTAKDSEANRRFVNDLHFNYLNRMRAKKVTNDKYRAKLKNRMNPDLQLTPGVTFLLAKI